MYNSSFISALRYAALMSIWTILNLLRSAIDIIILKESNLSVGEKVKI